jgi:ADP-heptose:LPS heptosyltransferase
MELVAKFGSKVDVTSLQRELTNFVDVADLAGLIGNLDLVITVDTLQAHVAGALGKEVWIMSPPPPVAVTVPCRWQVPPQRASRAAGCRCRPAAVG